MVDRTLTCESSEIIKCFPHALQVISRSFQDVDPNSEFGLRVPLYYFVHSVSVMSRIFLSMLSFRTARSHVIMSSTITPSRFLPVMINRARDTRRE